METRNASVVFWIVLVFSSNSSATLIDRGPSTADTDTRLEWLDVSQTTGVSYNQILSGYGGWLSAGWRYATEDEVDGLLSTYLGLPGISTNPDRNLATQQFISLFGATAIMPTFPLYQRVYGVFDDSHSHPFEQFVGRGDIFYEESFAYSLLGNFGRQGGKLGFKRICRAFPCETGIGCRVGDFQFAFDRATPSRYEPSVSDPKLIHHLVNWLHCQ